MKNKIGENTGGRGKITYQNGWQNCRKTVNVFVHSAKRFDYRLFLSYTLFYMDS